VVVALGEPGTLVISWAIVSGEIAAARRKLNDRICAILITLL
jgi:hypothetical protein